MNQCLESRRERKDSLSPEGSRTISCHARVRFYPMCQEKPRL